MSLRLVCLCFDIERYLRKGNKLDSIVSLDKDLTDLIIRVLTEKLLYKRVELEHVSSLCTYTLIVAIYLILNPY